MSWKGEWKLLIPIVGFSGVFYMPIKHPRFDNAIMEAFYLENDSIPAQGLPTLLNLGATTCLFCKIMAPIVEKLKIEYRGR